MNKRASYSAPNLDFNTPAAARLRRFRAFKDRATTSAVGVGGVSVIFAILLIFIYLMYEVAPLFKPASISQADAPYARPGDPSPTLYLVMEEQSEVAMRLSARGQVTFFEPGNGDLIKESAIELPAGATITDFALESEPSRIFALGTDQGSVVVAKHEYRSTYPDGERLITPSIIYPYGEEALEISDEFGAIDRLGVRDNDAALALVASNAANDLALVRFAKEENFITEEVELTRSRYTLPHLAYPAKEILISPDQRWVYVIDSEGQIVLIEVTNPDSPMIRATIKAAKEIRDARFLLGGASLLTADQKGVVSQWFLVRDEENQWQLKKIRSFQSAAPAEITTTAIEHRRKGFAAAESDGTVSLYNTTAENRVISKQLSESPIEQLTLSPRANALLLENASGQMSFWQVENKHPEVSWSALWGKVWYEGYEEPEYIWQSSAATNDFEPKYSLMPLAFGTLKAAFYAMLLATPLAIGGAVYTAYFMAPALRRKVKPFIELMEALPTVILGFLAGLWLAPFVESNLSAIFALLLVVPGGIIAFAFGWAQLPKRIRYLVPEGWDAALLLPVVVALTWLTIPLSDVLEGLLFGGDMRGYLTNELGIPFDQRNALVVGLAMGFAVIPTIFSITEDAIFSVPKSLSQGSLALGATPWQTLTRVVLPTASPGIFSAVMIGMGRAVGETMIVLMATGNTPIMDLNIFEGMRTLAANIAVEVPESEVGSSHYRVLFLAALVLFLFTFLVNTVAEVIRQRLRKKYGSL